MFMGDAGVTTEKEILNKYNLSDIDVLKVGHHGSKTSSSREFIDEINPKYSIISVGKNNRYGHPNKEVLNNLDDFLNQLGIGFTYVGNEYKIKIGNTYNYIDKNIKTIEENYTVGIIVCKQDNEYVIKYCSDDRIIAREYELV